MNPEYLATITDEKLEALLLDLENIPAVEELLRSSSEELERLKGLEHEGRLRFGKKIDHEDIPLMLQGIKPVVDSFLGLENMTLPRYGTAEQLETRMQFEELYAPKIPAIAFTPIGYGLPEKKEPEKPEPSLFTTLIEGFISGISDASITTTQSYFPKRTHVDDAFGYSPSHRFLIWKKNQRMAQVAPALGHEYGHSIEMTMGLTSTNNEVWAEGECRGIERNVAETYRDRSGNEAFMFQYMHERVGELKSAYLWMCDRLGQEPNKELLGTKTNRDSDERRFRKKTGKPTPHSIGHTLFLLLEPHLGKDQLYRDAMHGNIDFTKSPADYLRSQS